MKDDKQITGDGYIALTSAIIERACGDYVLAVKHIKEMVRDDWFETIKKHNRGIKTKKMAMEKRKEIIDEAESEIRRIRKFFRSDWFTVISNLDPDFLITELDKKSML